MIFLLKQESQVSCYHDDDGGMKTASDASKSKEGAGTPFLLLRENQITKTIAQIVMSGHDVTFPTSTFPALLAVSCTLATYFFFTGFIGARLQHG